VEALKVSVALRCVFLQIGDAAGWVEDEKCDRRSRIVKPAQLPPALSGLGNDRLARQVDSEPASRRLRCKDHDRRTGAGWSTRIDGTDEKGRGR
jgi:hypothetical protein